MPDAQSKREITSEAFQTFLDWLSPDRGSPGEAYEHLRYCLSTFFARRGSNFSDELADETINRVIAKIGSEEIENKMGYCYGVARNVYFEWLRSPRAEVDIEKVTIVAPDPEEPSFSHDCLDKCLATMPEASRTLLLDYFSKAKRQKIEMRRQISERLKSTQTALRMSVMRQKRNLKRCVQECMNS